MAEILGFARVMVVAATGNDATFVSRAIPNQMRPDETQHISITVMNTGGTTWTVERLHRLGAGSLKTGNPHNNGFGWSNFASGGYSNNVLDQRAFLPKTVALGYTVTFAFVRSFSVGIPDVTDGGALWRAFYLAIDAAKANGGVLGLHEYSAPTMQNQFDESSGEGWLTGRYRKVYRYFLIPDGKTIPLIITECGIDGGVIGQAGNGWKHYASAQEYFNQLVWYDGLLKADGYVLGATIFCLEIPNWESFDTAEVMNYLAPYVRG